MYAVLIMIQLDQSSGHKQERINQVLSVAHQQALFPSQFGRGGHTWWDLPVVTREVVQLEADRQVVALRGNVNSWSISKEKRIVLMSVVTHSSPCFPA